MKKVYDHAVIYNGKFYPANTEIEVKQEKTANEENSATEKETETKTAKKPKKAV